MSAANSSQAGGCLNRFLDVPDCWNEQFCPNFKKVLSPPTGRNCQTKTGICSCTLCPHSGQEVEVFQGSNQVSFIISSVSTAASLEALSIQGIQRLTAWPDCILSLGTQIKCEEILASSQFLSFQLQICDELGGGRTETGAAVSASWVSVTQTSPQRQDCRQ